MMPSLVALWIFGYGSLIFRPDFPFAERRRARAAGYARRFYQGSPDHRGTPEDLGRVVTLVPSPDGFADGIAYRVEPHHEALVLAALDEREQGGYERAVVRLTLRGAATGEALEATTWIAGEGNPYWLGPDDETAIVDRIRRARGPSGANRDYVLRLRDALRAEEIDDPHVEALAQRVGA